MVEHINTLQEKEKTECFRQYPRINQLAGKFERIASGRQGVPENPYNPHPDLFRNDFRLQAYFRYLFRHVGIFYRHAITSIPYYMEEDCRLGAALSEFLKRKNRITSCFTVGSGDGVFASTLAEAGDGRIKVLTNTPTRANVRQFYRTVEKLNLPRRKRATMYFGPFYELTNRKFAVDPALRPFRKGLDAIYETLTFQMYSADRESQIKLMKERLAGDGILVLCEKLDQADPMEYHRRETLKDSCFKLKYYSREQIWEKQAGILNTMQRMQVNETELARAVRKSFRYAYVVWNSCNFHTIVCSDSAIHLKQMIGLMTGPCIPQDFVFTTLPRPLQGFPDLNCSFRIPQPKNKDHVSG